MADIQQEDMHRRMRAILTLFEQRLLRLLLNRRALGNVQPTPLAAQVLDRVPNLTEAQRDMVMHPEATWDLTLLLHILLSGRLVVLSEAEVPGMGRLRDARNQWAHAANGRLTRDEFDYLFRILLAEAEALGVNREELMRLHNDPPGFPGLAAAAGGVAGGAVAVPVVTATVAAIGFQAGGIAAGSTAASMMSNSIWGVPLLQSIGAAGLGAMGATVAVLTGGVLVAAAAGGIAYGVSVHQANLVKERLARPTFNSTVLQSGARIRLFSVALQRFITVDAAGEISCFEAQAPGANGQFIVGFSHDNKVWLQNVQSDRYLRHGARFHRPGLRFDGAAPPKGLEHFDLFYTGMDRIMLKSVYGYFMSAEQGDGIRCARTLGDPACEFELSFL
jgi:hypothetical protein